MGVVIGVMVGYALGCRSGPNAWSEFEEAWHTISTSKEVRDFVDGALAIARDLLEKRIEVITGILGAPDDGFNIDSPMSQSPSPGGGTLHLALSVGFGEIQVVDSTGTPVQGQ